MREIQLLRRLRIHGLVLYGCWRAGLLGAPPMIESRIPQGMLFLLTTRTLARPGASLSSQARSGSFGRAALPLLRLPRTRDPGHRYVAVEMSVRMITWYEGFQKTRRLCIVKNTAKLAASSSNHGRDSAPEYQSYACSVTRIIFHHRMRYILERGRGHP